jgi:hypothetical protein
MNRPISYESLGRMLESLGYVGREVEGKHLLFQNPARGLLILLPEMPPDGLVRPIDVLRTRKTLVDDGVIRDEDFDGLLFIQKGDRLLWNDPATGREVPVTAAAGESDGLVVIQLRGALVPCPVDQLRKEPAVARSGAHSG